jgi:hypothetical protein
MKNSSILAALVMAVIGAGGIVGSTSGFGTSISNSNGNTAEQNGLMEGHVTLTAKHSDGTVFAYIQTDNTVTNVGKTCVAAIAFGVNSTSSTCYGTTRIGQQFTWIGLGNQTTVSPLTTDTQLGYQVLRQNATAAFGSTSGSGVTNATGTGHAYAIIQTVFTVPATLTGGLGSGPGNNTGGQSLHQPTTLTEAGLFDAQGQGAGHPSHMFAHTALSSSVSVNSGDQVTVKYSIAVG